MKSSSPGSFAEIRKIDNTRHLLPVASTFVILLLIIIGVWFFRGGSFRLYASLFFGLYYITHSSWLSIILVSVVQNIIFLPLRVLYERFYPDIKQFEDELTDTHKDDQYLLLNKKVREGDASILFYILNFVLLLIAFISAGRVFLLEFYHTPIDPKYLYDFIPYPEYPLRGVTFYFPFFNITDTIAFGWKTIAYLWLVPVLVFAVLRIFWRLLKPILSSSKTLLSFRINYNRLVLYTSGFIGTLLIATTYLLRHFPVSAEFIWLSADLSKQNTVFNIITAACTFLATIYAGFQHNQEATIEARKKNIPENIIAKVNHAHIRNSFRNGLLLSLFALWITRLMPCSHDLSVLAFEFLYIISPITFDLLIPKSPHRTSQDLAKAID